MTDTIQVVTATSSKEEAEKIARALVERRLAACVQVAGPVTSTYHWQGQIESAQEFLCIIKTRQSHYLALEDAIRELHSYEVPEILALEVSAGNRDYLNWLRDELADLSGPDVV
ncbi:MAG TPA: divalent-cation tolerance protein CutA [Pirellulales bacterium]|jgi:periplasmic divalent cation tolerance protein|nr:divalent-cation tolerance protein CutA [Pirellulales bacterium]